jgi:iron complex outermembrane receptor protein
VSNRKGLTVNKTRILLSAAVCMPMLSYAQDAVTLDEVVVTSQRRSESLQDVPISVSAFTAADLVKSNVTAAKDYLQFTPNVAFTEDGQIGSRGINVSIRGVSNVSLGEISAQNSIGYYVDELNVGATASGAFNPQLEDMERIEVLRGPQGTYFGRNALGGAINITTQKPGKDFYAEASAYAGRFSTWGGSGVVNVPLSDKVFLRAVGAYDQSDGQIKNINPRGVPDSGYEYKHGRLALRALPNDQLTIDLSVSYTDEDEGFDGDVPSGVLDLDTKSIFGPDFAALPDGTGFYPQNTDKVNHDADEYNRNRITITNARVAYDFGGVELKSITGYIDSTNSRFFDQDNISVDAIVRQNAYSGKSFSEELRLQSTGDNKLNWTVGALYAQDKVNQFNSVRAGAEGSYTDPLTGDVIGLLPPIPAGFRINENNHIFKTTSVAAFADATYAVTDRAFFTLGARYTRDKIDSSSFGVVGFEAPAPDVAASRDFNDFSPRAVFKFKATDDVTTYVSASKGYKAGGVDLNGGVVTKFEPEDLWNYEAGIKTQFADGRVRLNGAIFYLDWKDLQVQTNYLAVPGDISSAVQKTLNAAKASSQGAEIELQAQLASDWQLGAGVGYLDAKFGDFPDAILAGNNQVDLTDQRLPKTPKITANAYLDYSPHITGDIRGFIRPEFVHRGETAGSLEGVAAMSGQLGLPRYPYVMESYDVVNLRFGVTSPAWDVLASIENVFGEDYYNGTDDHFGLSGIRLRPHPTIWTLRATYRFMK